MRCHSYQAWGSRHQTPGHSGAGAGGGRGPCARETGSQCGETEPSGDRWGQLSSSVNVLGAPELFT